MLRTRFGTRRCKAVRVIALSWSFACLSTFGYSKDIESIARACEHGESKACADLKDVATKAKHPAERLAAVRLISNDALLTEIAADGSQSTDVRQAAQTALDSRRKAAEEQAQAKKAEAAERTRLQEESDRRREGVRAVMPQLTESLTTLATLLNASAVNLAAGDHLQMIKVSVDASSGKFQCDAIGPGFSTAIPISALGKIEVLVPDAAVSKTTYEYQKEPAVEGVSRSSVRQAVLNIGAYNNEPAVVVRDQMRGPIGTEPGLTLQALDVTNDRLEAIQAAAAVVNRLLSAALKPATENR